MQRRPFSYLAAGAALAALACPAALLPWGPAWAQAPNASFNLVNQSPTPIEEVYATSAGQTNWGRDRLGGNQIPPGRSRAIRLPANGTCIYDIRVVYAGGRADQKHAVNTCNVDQVAFGAGGPPAAAQAPGGTPGAGSGPGVPNPFAGGPAAAGQAQPGGGGAANPSFNLMNRGQKPLQALYASPVGEDGWGPNRLPEGGLDPGGRAAIRLPGDGTCDYKLRAVFRDGQTLSRRSVNLCSVTDLPVP